MVAIGMEQMSMMECGLIPAQTVGTIILQILMAQIAPVQIVMTVGQIYGVKIVWGKNE